eukprot:6431998-Prymnesium_polylepis.1
MSMSVEQVGTVRSWSRSAIRRRTSPIESSRVVVGAAWGCEVSAKHAQNDVSCRNAHRVERRTGHT